nr:hypothetical protein [uncultured bacterium]
MTSLLIERRRNERSKVMFSVNIEGVHRAAEGRLANVSPDGACIIGVTLDEGSPVLLQRNGMHMPGRVTWASGDQSGICFAEQMNPQNMLRSIATPQARVSYASKRPGLKCRPLSRADIALLERSATAGTVRG